MTQLTIRIRPPMLGLDTRCVWRSEKSATCSDFTDASHALSGGHGLARVVVRQQSLGAELKNRASLRPAPRYRHCVLSRSRDG